MKLAINTEVVQRLVAKAMKGASCNKMLPLTNLMAITMNDGCVTFVTTDGTNYTYIHGGHVSSGDFYAVVPADLFSKLIARLTCESCTIEITDDSLVVHGNGNYSIELPLDEEGNTIRFPEPFNKVDAEKWQQCNNFNVTNIKQILNTCKASLATSPDMPCYTGYYVGEKSVITTDTYKLCGLSGDFLDTPKLISAELMNLLDLLAGSITVCYRDNEIVFLSDGCTIYGKTMSCINDFQVDAIEGLLEQKFPSSCKIYKGSLLQLLDRLSLFVGAYDKDEIYLTFTEDGINVESKQTTGSELIQYESSAGFKSFTCCINIDMFQSQIKANSGEYIELQYGANNAIKIIDGNVTQIIALMEDDRA